LIATVLKNKFDTFSIISIQNIDQNPVDLSVSFYNADNPSAAPITDSVSNLAFGAAKIYDMGKLSTSTHPAIPDGFNGSMTVIAVEHGTTTPGKIVGTSMEEAINGTNASAFEGVQAGANTVYMPSAICNKFNNNSNYAVQNTSNTASANVTVTYSSGVTDGYTIAAGTKKSFNACTKTDGTVANASNYSGSATIKSVGAPIIAIGKISGAGASTAFVGATSGADHVALPYVRWSISQFTTGGRQHANIAIQNIGPDLAAGAVVVNYLDKNGNIVGTDPLAAIPQNQKVNSNPSNIGAAGNEFGYYSDGSFGGGAEVVGPSGSQLVVVVRISSYVPATGLTVAEDYNGMPYTPVP
jgi:hypothetical protein